MIKKLRRLQNIKLGVEPVGLRSCRHVKPLNHGCSSGFRELFSNIESITLIAKYMVGIKKTKKYSLRFGCNLYPGWVSNPAEHFAVCVQMQPLGHRCSSGFSEWFCFIYSLVRWLWRIWLGSKEWIKIRCFERYHLVWSLCRFYRGVFSGILCKIASFRRTTTLAQLWFRSSSQLSMIEKDLFYK